MNKYIESFKAHKKSYYKVWALTVVCIILNTIFMRMLGKLLDGGEEWSSHFIIAFSILSFLFAICMTDLHFHQIKNNELPNWFL